MPWWWSSSTLTAMESSDDGPPDAAGEKEDERREDRADDERPGLGERAQPVLEHEVRHGADEGPEEGSRTAEERHHHDLAGRRPVERLDRHDGQAQGVERAGKAREHRG